MNKSKACIFCEIATTDRVIDKLVTVSLSLKGLMEGHTLRKSKRLFEYQITTTENASAMILVA